MISPDNGSTGAIPVLPAKGKAFHNETFKTLNSIWTIPSTASIRAINIYFPWPDYPALKHAPALLQKGPDQKNFGRDIPYYEDDFDYAPPHINLLGRDLHHLKFELSGNPGVPNGVTTLKVYEWDKKTNAFPTVPFYNKSVIALP